MSDLDVSGTAEKLRNAIAALCERIDCQNESRKPPCDVCRSAEGCNGDEPDCPAGEGER